MSPTHPNPVPITARTGADGPHLDRRLRTVEYFTLAFGTMVGVGWLVIIDDWLTRGGPLGAMLGFFVCGLMFVPIGLTYARLVTRLPDAGGEVAYTEHVFSRPVSFLTGWFMALAYLIVCPWEAVAIGKLLARGLPQLDAVELYTCAGKPVYLYRLLIGLALTALICGLNYRGLRLSAAFQNSCTFALLAVFAVFSALGLARGNLTQVSPLFSHPGWWGGLVSVLLVMQIVPYFMAGFESVAKASEEAHAEFKQKGFYQAILMSIGGGAAFYVMVVLVVAMVYSWQELRSVPFGTAVAFERAFNSRRIGDLIFLGAVVSLFKVYNGNFVAGTRMVYGMARRQLLHTAFGRVHPRFLTPHVAVVFAGVLSALGAFLGEAMLVPMSEVGAMAIAVGWLASCLAFLKGVAWPAGSRPSRLELWAARIGAVVASGLLLIKFLPFVPGHLSVHEYIALAIWLALGLVLWRVASTRPEHRRDSDAP